MGGWAKRLLASKAAVVALSQILGVEWIKYGIRVNAINPRSDRDAVQRGGVQGRAGRPRGLHQSRRCADSGRPEEIADAVLFLASDESSNVNAEAITIDGGWDGLGSLTSDDPGHLRTVSVTDLTAARRSSWGRTDVDPAMRRALADAGAAVLVASIDGVGFRTAPARGSSASIRLPRTRRPPAPSWTRRCRVQGVSTPSSRTGRPPTEGRSTAWAGRTGRPTSPA